MNRITYRYLIRAILRVGPLFSKVSSVAEASTIFRCPRAYVLVKLALWLAVAMPIGARAADQAVAAFPIMFFDRSLQTIYSRDFLATWFAPRAPIDVVNGQRLARPVASCAELAALAQGAEITVKADEREVFERDYDMCFTLSALAHAAPARASNFDHARLGEDLFHHLDLSTIAIEFDAFSPTGKAPKGSYTLSDLRFSEAEVLNQGITVSNGHWSFRLTFQAAADFSGTETEELLVAFRLERHEGSSMSGILLLSRNEASGPITARQPPLRPPSLIQFLPP